MELVGNLLNKESIIQYQAEERTKVVFRMASALYRMKELIDIMCHDTISTPEKIGKLASELAEHFKQKMFLRAKTMGHIVKIQLKQILLPKLKMVPVTKVKFDD